METLVRPRLRRALAILAGLASFIPVAASAQTTPPAPPVATAKSAEQSKMVITFGGTATTLRGDCQEDCELHGTGVYLHTYSLIGSVGYRVNRQMDGGLEVSWVPATSAAGADIRTTFVLGSAQFRPMVSRGLFLKAGMGMAFVRNFVYDANGALPPVTSKALGLTYGVGWTFRQDERVGLRFFADQHVLALGDFQTGGVTVSNVVGNFWSVGAAVVIR
jgi:hypothetical protein